MLETFFFDVLHLKRFGNVLYFSYQINAYQYMYLSLLYRFLKVLIQNDASNNQFPQHKFQSFFTRYPRVKSRKLAARNNCLLYAFTAEIFFDILKHGAIYRQITFLYVFIASGDTSRFLCQEKFLCSQTQLNAVSQPSFTRSLTKKLVGYTTWTHFLHPYI